MSTRALSLPLLLALLAVLPAVRVQAQAQSPTAPAPEAVSATPPAATAQPAPVPAPAATTVAAPAPAAAAPAAVAAAKGKDAAGRDTLSVDFPDEDIRNILRNVADLFELNIIMPDTLQGKTTIKLRDVTWRQIFESVLTPVGYTYKEDGNIIKIVSNESLAQEPVSTDVFIINYAKAADILPTIQSLVDTATGGKIVVDTRSNSLVITERPSRMNRIRPLIEQLDRATDQVMIETKFVEVTDQDVKDIGVNWSSLAAYRIGAGGINENISRQRGQTGSDGFNATRGTTRSVVGGTTDSLTTTVTNGQTSGSTNTNTVTAANGAPTSAASTGTTGALNNSVTTTGTTGVNNTATDNVNDAFNRLASLLNSDGVTRTVNAVFTASDFNLVLSALQQFHRTKIVNNPTIVTLNNTQASINIGRETPIPSYTYNQQTGSFAISGFTYKPIGVILKVTPQVNARGHIRLTVDPEVSQASGSVDFQGASLPVVETRKASTTVSLRDGYTMGIGGLLQSTSINGNSKVPILGSVPVLGRLFRSDNKNDTKSNLIIFITAKTLSAEGASIEQVFDSEQVRGLEMRREDLPGHRDGSNPFVTPPPPDARRGFFNSKGS